MDREQHVRPIPTVVTNNCDTGFDMTGSTTGKSAANAVIAQGCHGERVADINGDELGDVDHLTSDVPRAAAAMSATQYDPSLIEAFFGMSEPDHFEAEGQANEEVFAHNLVASEATVMVIDRALGSFQIYRPGPSLPRPILATSLRKARLAQGHHQFERCPTGGARAAVSTPITEVGHES